MKKSFLSIVLLLGCLFFGYSETTNQTTQNQDNQLILQLVDAKLLNLDDKINRIEVSNQKSKDSFESSINEKLDTKSKQLDNRAENVDWWLNLVFYFFITLIAVVGVIVPYIGYKVYKQFKEKLDESEKYLLEIKDNHQKSIHLTKEQERMVNNPPEEVNDNNFEDIKSINEAISTKLEKDLTAKEWFIRGLYAERKEKYYDAIYFYNRSIAGEGVYEAYNNLGTTKAKIELYRESIKDFDKAIKLNDNRQQAWFNKGLSYYFLKEYLKAINCFNESIKRFPSRGSTYLYKAKSLLEINMLDEALKEYDKVIQLENDNSGDVLYERCLLKVDLKLYKEALDDIEESIKIENDGNKVFCKSCILVLMKNKVQALKCLEEALSLGVSIVKIENDEDWSKYKDDPDFKALIAKYKK